MMTLEELNKKYNLSINIDLLSDIVYTIAYMKRPEMLSEVRKLEQETSLNLSENLLQGSEPGSIQDFSNIILQELSVQNEVQTQEVFTVID
jgi:hypothetical protein